MKNYYLSGSWNVICQLCGKKIKAANVFKRWDGLLVCEDDYEQRNILDFMRIKSDEISVPYLNPESPDQFITVPYYDAAIAGIAIAGKAVAGVGG